MIIYYTYYLNCSEYKIKYSGICLYSHLNTVATSAKLSVQEGPEL